MEVSLLPAWCRIVREVTPMMVDRMAAREPVRSPREAAALVIPNLGLEEVEVFAVILLDAQHKAIAFQEVTRGLVNSTLVHPREVFRLAIAMNATAVICAHNHPSGDLTPSAEDRVVTEQLVAAGRLLDIPVHDHVIVGSAPDKYTSFAESGLI